MNWTVTQCHAADFYEDVCQNGRIYWAYTLQKPGVNAIKEFINPKSMIAKKEEGEADEAKAIWVSFTFTTWARIPPSLSDVTRRVRYRFRAMKAYPHTEVGVHSTGSWPGRWVWSRPLACSLAHSPPDTPPCGRSQHRCTSESHAGAERGVGRSGLWVEKQ